MSENTLPRADDWLREQLAENPPVQIKLLDDDLVLGTLIREEARQDDKGNEFEVAVIGEVDVTDMADPPDGLDGDEFASFSISGANIKRQWDQLKPKPGERIGVRRIRSVKTNQGRDTVLYNLRVYRPEGDGSAG
jgi:hypothetical protein